MLLDPRKYHPSWPGVVAWLETKHPYERYYYANASNCACGQYNRECAFVSNDVGGWVFDGAAKGKSNVLKPNDTPRSRFWYELNQLARGAEGHTFGALLKCARARVAVDA